MQTISVVGAGQAGTLLAVGLRKAGYDVQLFSDKTAEQMRDDIAPTGAAAIFADSVDVERRLGCDPYEQQSVPMDGIHLFFSPKVGQELVHFGAPLEEAAGAAVDVRLKSYDRMRQLEELGGRLVIDSVDVDSLDEIAADSALTVVSTGRGGLSTLFPRHPGRSVYDKAQRQLLMILVRGIATDGTAFPNRLPGQTPVCFNLFGDAGESDLSRYPGLVAVEFDAVPIAVGDRPQRQHRAAAAEMQRPVPGVPTQIYVGFVALVANLVVAVVVTAVARMLRAPNGNDQTTGSDYHADEGATELRAVGSST